MKGLLLPIPSTRVSCSEQTSQTLLFSSTTHPISSHVSAFFLTVGVQCAWKGAASRRRSASSGPPAGQSRPWLAAYCPDIAIAIVIAIVGIDIVVVIDIDVDVDIRNKPGRGDGGTSRPKRVGPQRNMMKELNKCFVNGIWLPYADRVVSGPRSIEKAARTYVSHVVDAMAPRGSWFWASFDKDAATVVRPRKKTSPRRSKRELPCQHLEETGLTPQRSNAKKRLFSNSERIRTRASVETTTWRNLVATAAAAACNAPELP